MFLLPPLRVVLPFSRQPMYNPDLAIAAVTGWLGLLFWFRAIPRIGCVD